MTAIKADGILTIALSSYNDDQYIREAVESVVKQSVPNWELVIYHNGSSDDIYQLLKPYLQHPQVTLLHEQNIEAGNNIDAAIAQAESEFFAIMPADGFLQDTFVENTLLQFHRHPDSPFVFFDWLQYLDETKTTGEHNSFPFSTQRSGPIAIGPFLSICNFVPFHLTAFRTTCLQNVFTQLHMSPLKQRGEQLLLKLLEDQYGLGCYSGAIGGAWRRPDQQATALPVKNSIAIIEEPIERQWYLSKASQPNNFNAFMALATQLPKSSGVSLFSVADWLLQAEGQRYAESFNLAIEQQRYRFQSIVLLVALKFAAFTDIRLYDHDELQNWLKTMGHPCNKDELQAILLDIMVREGEALINQQEIEQISHHCFEQQLMESGDNNAAVNTQLDNILAIHQQTAMPVLQIALSLLDNKKDLFPTPSDSEQLLFKACKHVFDALIAKEQKRLSAADEKQLHRASTLLKSARFELMSEQAVDLRQQIFDWKRDYHYQHWIDNHALMEVDAQLHAERMFRWLEQPHFHFVLFLAEQQQQLLVETLASLNQQLYKNWTLTVIAYGGPPDLVFAKEKQLDWVSLTGADTDLYQVLNNVCFSSTADWFAYIPAGTQFAPQMMLQVGDYINKYQHQIAYYCDDDLISSDSGQRYNPRFKPDFNLDMLRSTDYIGIVLCHAQVLTALGGFDALPGHEGMALAFKVIERLGSDSIGHISDILIHLPETVLQQRHQAVMRLAVEQHLQRLAIPATVSNGLTEQAVRVQYQWQESPLVSIIILSKDTLEFLRPCVESLLSKTAYPNYELLIVDNHSEDPDTLIFLDTVSVEYGDKVRVLSYPQLFNDAAISNMAAKAACGDYLLFLHNDTEVLHREWLSRMMCHAQRKEVGVVAAQLVLPETGQLQHAGMIMGLAGQVANYTNIDNLYMGESGYMDRLQLDQNFSTVSAACQLIRKALYEQVQGKDEDNFTISYSEIDLCLKIKELGYLLVWTPYVTLIHHGNVSQSSKPQLAKQQQQDQRAKSAQRLMMQKWRRLISRDPAYNRNLSLARQDMSIESTMPVNWDINFHDRSRIIGLPLNGGSGQYRVIQPFAALSHAAIAQCESYRFTANQSRDISVYEYARLQPDTLVFHAAVNDMMLQQIEEVAAQLPDIFRIYAIDDLLTDVPEQSSVYKAFRSNFADIKVRIRRALKACNRLIVSTKPLADLCVDMCDDIHIVPNYLPRKAWTQLTSLRNQGSKPRVGWAGAQQHQGDLAIIVDVVKETADEIDWIFMGMQPKQLEPYIKEYHQFVAMEDYPAKLASLNLDLALAPLEQHPFNEAKSNLRLLEYGIMGWPVICTDIYPYQTDNPPVVRVANDKAAWLGAIRELLSQPELLQQAGDALRQWVVEGYILEDHLQQWASALNIDP